MADKLQVQIENIIPVTEARDNFNQVVDKVESSDDMYVFTKNGKPSAILVGVHHLEKLTGESHEELFGTGTAAGNTPASTTDTSTTAATDTSSSASVSPIAPDATTATPSVEPTPIPAANPMPDPIAPAPATGSMDSTVAPIPPVSTTDLSMDSASTPLTMPNVDTGSGTTDTGTDNAFSLPPVSPAGTTPSTATDSFGNSSTPAAASGGFSTDPTAMPATSADGFGSAPAAPVQSVDGFSSPAPVTPLQSPAATDDASDTQI